MTDWKSGTDTAVLSWSQISLGNENLRSFTEKLKLLPSMTTPDNKKAVSSFSP